MRVLHMCHLLQLLLRLVARAAAAGPATPSRTADQAPLFVVQPAAAAPTDLLCDLRVSPVGVESRQPRLTWAAAKLPSVTLCVLYPLKISLFQSRQVTTRSCPNLLRVWRTSRLQEFGLHRQNLVVAGLQTGRCGTQV